MATILVTGAAGFIGSNFVRMLLGREDQEKIVALDKLTYAGNLENLADVLDDKRLVFIKGDICDAKLVAELWDGHRITHVVNFAAESHVDRSIISSAPFVQTNVVGTQVLLDAARQKGVERFVQISTDEVYGSLPEDQPQVRFTEQTPLQPNSPYSASKAAADCLVRAYHHTFGLPAIITRCSNNYGPYQFPEKVIPLFITNLLEGKRVPLYGDGLNRRDWIHVQDHCEGVFAAMERGRPGEVYNFGGDSEMTNRQLTQTILRLLGRQWEESVEFVKDRPGHDRRYAIDATKAKKELGWSPRHTFDQGIAETIDWYREHQSWWRSIKSGEYLRYYQQQYVNR